MTKLFYRNSDKKIPPSFTIKNILNLMSEPKGDIGIEIEVEGKRLPCVTMGSPDDIKPYWRYVQDHSLRGDENGEYVLRSPIKFEQVEAALDVLWGAFEKHKTKLDDSNRTSVHIHLNCQHFYLNRLTSLMALYIVFEEILTEWCGDHRVGNLFCLRAKDAPAIVSRVKSFIQKDGREPISEHLHYSGMNLHSLKKYGSLEFRSLRGVQDKADILTWVSILERLYAVSETMDDPREVCYKFSEVGPLGFFESILGSHALLIQDVTGWTGDRIRDSMYEGIRLAQDLCFCRDWGAFKKLEVKKDPFGRRPYRVVQSIINQAPIAADDDGLYNPSPSLTISSSSLLNALNAEPGFGEPAITPPTVWLNPPEAGEGDEDMEMDMEDEDDF